jgi:hypothetical protein
VFVPSGLRCLDSVIPLFVKGNRIKPALQPGGLNGWEVALAIQILIVSAAVILALAVRVFRFGALEYSRKLSLKEIFGR